MIKNPLFALGLIGIIFLVSCTNDNPGNQKAPIKIIFDTDMGSDCDDVGALALLHQYADMAKAEIIGCIYSSGKIPYGAGVIEGINIYYGRPDIPIGANHNDSVGDPVDKMTAEKLARDTTAFGNHIIHNHDAEAQTRLNRKLLADQKDYSVHYVTIGHTKGLYDLLVSKPDDISPLSGVELIQQKVKRWVALGALDSNNEDKHYTKDWNFFFNNTAPFTAYLIEHLPIPIVFVDAGSDVMTGKALKNTPPGNIVRTAYRDWLWNVEKKTLDDQRPSWDLVTIYYAIEGTGDFLVDEGEGWLEFDMEKGCRWQSEASQYDHRLISQKENVEEDFAEYLNGMISNSPGR